MEIIKAKMPRDLYRKGQVRPHTTSVPRSRKSMREALLPYLFMGPAIAVLAFIYLAPIIFMLAISVTDWTGVGWRLNFVGLQNFVRIVTGGERALTPVVNVIVFAVGTVVIQNVLGLAFALVLDRDFRGREFFRTIFFMPTVIASIAVAQMWKTMLIPGTGTIANIAGSLGLKSITRILWLGDTDIVMYVLIGINVWQWFGYNMVIYLAGLQNIPVHLYEAADVDGASGFDKLRYITLPLLGPAATISIILTTIGALKMFDLPYLLTQGGPGNATKTITMDIVQRTFLNNDLGYASALSVLLLMGIALITVVQNRTMRRWRQEEP
jgi:raffinose/stachyose/melibiose transport system permease protein